MSPLALGARAALAALCAVAGSSCATQFPAPNLVDRPRVLLITAAPIAVMAGQTLTARATVVGASGVTEPLWRVCVPARIDPFPEQRCADGEGAVAFTQRGGDTLAWQVPSDEAELTTLLFAGFVDASGNIPNPTTVLNQVRSSGVELLVYFEASAPHGGAIVKIRGVKRALFAITNLRVNSLSIPRFSFGAAELSASGEACATMEGGEVLVSPSENLQVNLLQTGPEFGEQVSYFADGGSFAAAYETPEINRWTAPSASGAVTRHWLVVQRSVPRAQGARVSDLRFCEWRTRVR